MMRRKPAQNFLRPIAPWVKSVRGVAIPGHEECYAGNELAEAALEVEIPDAKAALDVEAAIADIIREEKKPARILICGSLYLRSEEHTSELQSLMRISYAVFCLKKKKNKKLRQ